MGDSRSELDELSSGLIRAGVLDLPAANTALTAVSQALGLGQGQAGLIVEALQEVCGPDTALAAYAQLCVASPDWPDTALRAQLGPTAAGFKRLLRLLGVSEALGRLMTARPDLVRAAVDETAYDSHRWSLAQRVQALLDSVQAEAVGGAGPGDTAGPGDDTEQAQPQLTGQIPAHNSQSLSNQSWHGQSLPGQPRPGQWRSTLPFEEAVTHLRREYYRQLTAIMAWDAVAPDPAAVQPQVSAALSDLAQAALEAGLAAAYAKVEDSKLVRFAAIGMGKLGAHELNYVSDVDLIYVVEPQGEVSHQQLLKIGTKLGISLGQACSSVLPAVAEPALWQIDGALRPEGKDGQLVRRLASHEEYYKQWAKNWEFQALLKARPVAGDTALGTAYERMAQSFVWQAASRNSFVFDCQQMRTRVEDLIPGPLKDREIKLGRGGLRDVEFTVQMLQLVHGRTDQSLRGRGTLEALDALKDGGYVARSQADQLSQDYRFERVLEHRAQMWGLQRTHLFPDLGTASQGGLDSKRPLSAVELDSIVPLRRLARAFGLKSEQLVSRYDEARRQVRRLHLDIYYRPMLPQLAGLGEDEIQLSGEAAFDRFTSIGFADPQAAMRHIAALTAGISRAAKINRIILPSFLQWLGQGQNPDMGLLALRKLEESFGQHTDYLGFLRDSLSAGQRLCRVVANSRYLADALSKSAESVTWLGDDEQLQARSRQSLDLQCRLSLRRFADSLPEFATSVRALRRHEIERIGLAWMSGLMKSSQALAAMTDVYDAVLDAALNWAVARQMATAPVDDSSVGLVAGTVGDVTADPATRTVAGAAGTAGAAGAATTASPVLQAETVTPPAEAAAPARIAILAMGRYGGREVNFSSDADVIALYEKTEGADDQAAAFARAVLDDLRAILSSPVSREPAISLDFDLRPEGKNGPLIRSFESCREYYAHWASTWEAQALLRARYAAGDQGLAQRFLSELADPLRYPTDDLNAKQIQEIRKLKARMEAERLPRGVRRERHLKLGKGSLSDVEWTVQFLQLRHAGHNPLLRTVSTVSALRQLRDDGILSQTDAASLEAAWKLTTDARNANFLWSSRAEQADILPDDVYSLGGVAACMGRDAHRGQEFENELLTALRHSRAVTDRLFYGNEG